jgi:dipeptidyl aminopeptidase/acylaminoacyl peptidase
VTQTVPRATSTAQWPFVSADGLLGGFVRVASRQPGGATTGNEGVYAGPLTGTPARLDCPAPACPPVLDTSGRLLLLAHEAGAGWSRLSIARLDRPGRPPLPLGRLPGSVQQLLWDEERGRVIALVAEPGSDTASLTSGRHLPGPEEDPLVDLGHEGAQRLWCVPLATGRAAPLGPATGSVWEAALAPDGTLVCVYSADAGEAAWYSAFVGRFDLAGGSLVPLYKPEWQVSWATVDPTDGSVAFVEGWASDRGLLAGDVVVTAADGEVLRRYEGFGLLGADVTWLAWGKHGELWFAGWNDLGTAWGCVEKGGRHWSRREPGSLVGSRWHPALAISADGGRALACRYDEQAPHEVVVFGREDGPRVWVPGEGEAPTMTVVEGTWPGKDREVHGILLVPGTNGGPLVVLAHGGPTLSYHHAFDPAGANRLLEEGFSVLLPNPSGSTGRGQAFTRANHGDPGGGELDEVLAGAAWAVSTGLVPAGRPAIMGSSYGGYLAAFAACTRGPAVSAAVVHAGISDIASCRHTANNAPFWDLLLGGPPHKAGTRSLCVQRSPIYAAVAPCAPTLVLHGQEDTCVPVGQAHELFGALRDLGTEAELVTYAREGHQLAEPEHMNDYWARILRWLDAHRDVSR